MDQTLNNHMDFRKIIILILLSILAWESFSQSTIYTNNIRARVDTVHVDSVLNAKTGFSIAGLLSFPLTDGSSGQVLKTDGSGNITWQTDQTGAGGSVAGSNQQVQFNNSGVFGASANFLWDGTDVQVNSIQPVSSSSGFTIKNQAGTGILTLGSGSSSSTNSSWTGTTNVTGQWNVDNLRMDGDTFSSTSGAVTLSSPSGGITLTPTGSNVNISTGGLHIGGTSVLTSGRALENVTTGNFSSNVTVGGALSAGAISGTTGTFSGGNVQVSDGTTATVNINGVSTRARLDLNAPIPDILFDDVSSSAFDAKLEVNGNFFTLYGGNNAGDPTSNYFQVNLNGGAATFSGSLSAGAISGTTGTFSGNVTTGDGSGNESLIINGGANSIRDLQFQTNGVNRWVFRTNGDAESGSNTGSNFEIIPLNDAGSSLGTALNITRSNGQIDAPGVYSETTTSAPNVFVDTDGSLRRSTSATVTVVESGGTPIMTFGGTAVGATSWEATYTQIGTSTAGTICFTLEADVSSKGAGSGDLRIETTYPVSAATGNAPVFPVIVNGLNGLTSIPLVAWIDPGTDDIYLSRSSNDTDSSSFTKLTDAAFDSSFFITITGCYTY